VEDEADVDGEDPSDDVDEDDADDEDDGDDRDRSLRSTRLGVGVASTPSRAAAGSKSGR
jgi:hypothetical protein